MAVAIKQNGTNPHWPISIAGHVSLAPLFNGQGQLLP
jgi:hypothetical protein